MEALPPTAGIAVASATGRAGNSAPSKPIAKTWV